MLKTPLYNKVPFPSFIQDALKSYFGSDWENFLKNRAARDVAELSYLFTREKLENLGGGRYMGQKRFRDAYTCYYLPANLLKTVSLLEKAWAIKKPWLDKKELSILDAGCGPGTAAIGAAIFFHAKGIAEGWKHFKLRVHSLDNSREILRENTRLTLNFANELKRSFPGFEIEQHLHHANLSDGWKGLPASLCNNLDALFFSNVLAEMGPDQDSNARGLAGFVHQTLFSGGLAFFLEPAQRVYARKLLFLRDTFAGEPGLLILSPCPDIPKCPALNLSEKDWCHDRILWERPDFIALIDKGAGIRKESLRFSYLIISKGTLEGALEGRDRFVVVSDPMMEKGKFVVFLCGVKGRAKFELLKRDGSDSNKAFYSLRRGERLFLKGFVDKSGIKRLNQDSIVRVEPPVPY